MNSLCQQLTAAYRQEEKLYLRILELVEGQCRVMDEDPNPSAVLELCGEVEGLMDQISCVEKNVAPARERWRQDGCTADGELDSILATIQGAIEQIAEKQEKVRQALFQYLQRHDEQANRARASVNARRARLTYGTD